MGTSYPRDRLSGFVTEEWICHNRVAGLSEESIAPGNYATFTCKFKKNKFVHNSEIFQLVFDGKLWFPESEIIIDLDHKTITPVAPYGEPRINNSELKQPYLILNKAKNLALRFSGLSHS